MGCAVVEDEIPIALSRMVDSFMEALSATGRTSDECRYTKGSRYPVGASFHSFVGVILGRNASATMGQLLPRISALAIATSSHLVPGLSLAASPVAHSIRIHRNCNSLLS